MPHIFPIQPSLNTRNKSWAFWKDAFNYNEIKDIINLCETYPKQQGEVGGNYTGVQLEDMRLSTVAWVTPDDKSNWLYQRLSDLVRKVNDNYFGFNLWGFMDNFQYTIYEESNKGPGDHYNWHIDQLSEGQYARKLSMVMQLSDPQDYEGGELWVHGLQKNVLPKELGIIHFFPSYTLHRVTPVTSGKRMTLVGWASGPDFV